MTQKNYLTGCVLLLFLNAGCTREMYNPDSRPHEFPNYVDTETRPVQYQEKKTYVTAQGVSASNQFNGARLNDFEAENDSTFTVSIEPENTPINPSPWYAFKLWSETPRKVYLNIDYHNGKHRYLPKLSYDGRVWTDLDSNLIIKRGGNVQFPLNLSQDTLWVAGQELFTTEHLRGWLAEIKRKSPETKMDTYGKSTLGRPLYTASLFEKNKGQNEIIVLMSRQHPPETTGQLAFLHFVERLLEEDPLTEKFKQKYQVLLFPMQNPDGVDLGHWRHNAGGIDLNRDWDRYNQPETRQMAKYLVEFANKNQARVIMGLDFHSTYEDVYYTNNSDTASAYPDFTNVWLNEIKRAIPDYEPNISPSNVGQPVSKGWFFVRFNAVGITYEIGDDTPRDFIKTKSRIAAEKMMEVLLNDE
ncbi:M14 family metallopeptidase [Persicitalea jodogahamensis]|uniref:Peptidase M14 n=1 Tax=Persicitalea jodogahamensis TaxID=402147 RepID=A0A8J3G8B5_9BACT|nr:M14 family metallopeptidase [Persicitalea jodogahamensis]GHB64517.1 peptidase M14 [Persicitalea jodogahamensis]